MLFLAVAKAVQIEGEVIIRRVGGELETQIDRSIRFCQIRQREGKRVPAAVFHEVGIHVDAAGVNPTPFAIGSFCRTRDIQRGIFDDVRIAGDIVSKTHMSGFGQALHRNFQVHIVGVRFFGTIHSRYGGHFHLKDLIAGQPEGFPVTVKINLLLRGGEGGACPRRRAAVQQRFAVGDALDGGGILCIFVKIRQIHGPAAFLHAILGQCGQDVLSGGVQVGGAVTPVALGAAGAVAGGGIHHNGVGVVLETGGQPGRLVGVPARVSGGKHRDNALFSQLGHQIIQLTVQLLIAPGVVDGHQIQPVVHGGGQIFIGLSHIGQRIQAIEIADAHRQNFHAVGHAGGAEAVPLGGNDAGHMGAVAKDIKHAGDVRFQRIVAVGAAGRVVAVGIGQDHIVQIGVGKVHAGVQHGHHAHSVFGIRLVPVRGIDLKTTLGGNALGQGLVVVGMLPLIAGQILEIALGHRGRRRGGSGGRSRRWHRCRSRRWRGGWLRGDGRPVRFRGGAGRDQRRGGGPWGGRGRTGGPHRGGGRCGGGWLRCGAGGRGGRGGGHRRTVRGRGGLLCGRGGLHCPVRPGQEKRAHTHNHGGGQQRSQPCNQRGVFHGSYSFDRKFVFSIVSCVFRIDKRKFLLRMRNFSETTKTSRSVAAGFTQSEGSVNLAGYVQCGLPAHGVTGGVPLGRHSGGNARGAFQNARHAKALSLLHDGDAGLGLFARVGHNVQTALYHLKQGGTVLPPAGTAPLPGAV